MDRGPSVVACPEEGGKGGGGEPGAGLPPSQPPPNASQSRRLYPQQVLGLHRPWGAGGFSPLQCTFLQRPLGAVALRPSGPLHPESGMGGILRVGVGKGRDTDGVKERNGSERLDRESGKRLGEMGMRGQGSGA